nr:unnamed protein product [Spirometra erinaceieuropaei]
MFAILIFKFGFAYRHPFPGSLGRLWKKQFEAGSCFPPQIGAGESALKNDQTSNLLKYQESGIALHERIQKFLIDIGKLQTETFAAQKKLCEKYRLNIKKAIGLETTYESLMSLSFELHAMGETKKALDEERQQLKKWKQDRFQTEIKSQIKIIEEEKKRYREKYYEALRFKADFEKIDADNTYSRLEVEKALNLYSLKNCEFKRARADYIVALEQFNLNRGYHYNHTLKQWGEAGQEMEVYRIKKTQELLCVLAERLRVTIERMTSVCSDLEATAARIDAEKDSRALIERLRTGNLPPEDEPFEDLIIEDPPVVNLESYGESMKRQLSIGNLPSSVVNTDDPEAVANSHSPPGTLTPSTDAVGIVTRESPGRNKYGTKGRRMSSIPTVIGSGAAARRLSASSLALGNSQVNGNGQSIMRKLFSRRSKKSLTYEAPASCPELPFGTETCSHLSKTE